MTTTEEIINVETKFRYYYLNGNTFEGEWREDRKEGRGVYTYTTTGEKYEGEWRNGERNGKGNYYYAYGDVFNGT